MEVNSCTASQLHSIPIEDQSAKFLCHTSLYDLKMSWSPSPESLASIEELQLPPPAQYFDRRLRVPSPTPHRKSRTLTKSMSTTNIRNQNRSGHTALRTKNMSTSMPNLHINRSTHNREIGSAVLRSANESGNMPNRTTLLERREEFDALLEGL